jgi:hypothetical protein
MTMDAEIETFLAAIDESLEMIAVCLEGLDDDSIRWSPDGGANCLAVIAKHSIANAHRNVLAHFAGEPYDHRREEEFSLDGETGETLSAAFETLRGRMRARLDTMPHASLDAMCNHARLGAVLGRVVLLQAARHAAEHAGEARLTRRLILDRKTL